MNTIFLRFPDEATFTALMPAKFVRAGETGYPLPDGIAAISIVGTLFTAGTFDAAGNVLTPAVQVPGFHVNALATAYTDNGDGTSSPVLPAPFALYRVDPNPASPARVFGA